MLLSLLILSLLPFLFHSLPVLCPAHHLQCRHRRGFKPLHSRTMRSIAPWRYTILSPNERCSLGGNATISHCQRQNQQFEGGEHFDYCVGRKTGWRYYTEPRRNPPAASSSSSPIWQRQTSQWQTSWSSSQPTSSEKRW